MTNPFKMGRPLNQPRVSPRSISELLADFERYQREEAEVRKEYPWATRFVMGLPLPPWQRDLVWSSGRSARFIESIWAGVHIGSYVLTEAELAPGLAVVHLPLANCVMDGQQRLHALQLYFCDEIAVHDESGALARWSDLGLRDKRWFVNRIFDRGTVPLQDKLSLRKLYDLMNFGGVPHKESERAIPS